MPSRTIQESHRPRVSNRTMRCHSSSGQPSGFLVQKMTGAVTTVKWNHREEEAYLRFARGDETGLSRPEEDHSQIEGARSNSWAECRDEKGPASGREGRFFS